MIDVEGIKSFIENKDTIRCEDYDQRGVVLNILRKCGMVIGFEEEDYPKHLYVSAGSVHPDEIHCGRVGSIYPDGNIISGAEFLRTFCNLEDGKADKDITPPTMDDIYTLYHIERTYLYAAKD